MVTIRSKDGGATIKVPRTVWETHYKSLEWELADGKESKPEQAEIITETSGNAPEEIKAEENAMTLEEERKQAVEDVSEIPLEQMTLEQLRQYAGQLGLEFSARTQHKTLLNAVRQALNG